MPKPLMPTQYLLPFGLLVAFIEIPLEHYFAMPDLLKGCFIGAGIGIMMAAVIRKKRQAQKATKP